MRSDIFALLKSASKEAQAIMGESFTFAGETYKGTINRGDPEIAPGPNGFERTETLSIVATKTQFDSSPVAAPRASVTARSRSWWCTGVDSDDLHYFLRCVPK